MICAIYTYDVSKKRMYAKFNDGGKVVFAPYQCPMLLDDAVKIIKQLEAKKIEHFSEIISLTDQIEEFKGAQNV